jgi:hypothetical protein
MTNRFSMCLFTLVLLATGCTRERTQLMMRIRTDMTQGVGQQLSAVRINVFSDGQVEPTHTTTVPLGPDGVLLPQTLGMVPRGAHDARISALIEALGDGGVTLFSKRVAARYVPERTLLLDVMLAARCLDAAAQSCPSEQSCGASGCEADLRENLPTWTGDNPLDGSVDMSVEPVNDGMMTDDMDITDDMNITGDMPAPPDMQQPNDLTMPDLLQILDIGDPAVPAPRPVWPPSTAFTTSQTINFRWKLTAPATGGRLEICTDRACANVVQTSDVVGETTTATIVPTAGMSRVFFYRLTGLMGATQGATRSPVWSFSVSGGTPTPRATWGTTHDFNGDGLADIYGGSPDSNAVRLYRGRTPLGGAPTADTVFNSTADIKFGSAIVGAGDINGDGFADLAIGTNASVFVYHGRSVLPSSIPTASANSNFAMPAAATRHNLAAAGDVDGDGYADLVVGDPAMTRILMYSGGPTGVATVPVPLVRGETAFGKSVAGGCDVNADGFADLIVGGDGNATVILGSAAGPGTVISLTPGAALVTPTGFGSSVACAGDVNGDGYADVIVGAPLDDSAFVYHGGASGPTGSVSGALRKVAGESGTPTKHGDAFGTVVASGGDLNGDNFADVVVTAPIAPVGFDANFTGTVFIFHGSASGVPITAPGSSTAHQKALGATPPLNRPQVSQYAGDVDGDGVGDIVTGVPLRSTGGGVHVGRGASPGGIDLPTYPTWDLAASGLAAFGTTIARLFGFVGPHVDG